MGWCSATQIMDAALAGAEAAISAVLGVEVHQRNADGSICVSTNVGNPIPEEMQEKVDAALRPFVATIADMLRDGDWDCITESQYYDRFAQEMHGEDDREYANRLVEGLADAHETDRPWWLERLNKHYVKMENTDGAG